MPSVPGLRQLVRDGEPQPFAFEVTETADGLLRLTVLNGSDWCAGVYSCFHSLAIEVDPARWLAIFEACADRCREMAGVGGNTPEFPTLPGEAGRTAGDVLVGVTDPAGAVAGG